MDLLTLLNGQLKFRHLVIILAIQQNGTLLRTAEKLYMTQPALSRSLREAEKIMGAPLFERTGHGMEATQAGLVAVEHARSIVGQLETMDRRITELAKLEAGSVSIGAHVTGANTLVPRAVGQLLEEWPLMHVTIREAPPTTLIEELEAGGLDMLVGRITDHESTSRLRLIPLYSEPYRLVVTDGHPLIDQNPQDFRELRDQKWVIPLAGTPLRDAWEKAFFDVGLDLPQRTVECGTPAPMRTLIHHNGFIGVLPESMAEDDEKLMILAPYLSLEADSVGLMLAPDRSPTVAAQRLVDMLNVHAAILNEKGPQ